MRRARMTVVAALAAATVACGGGKQDSRSPADRDREGEAGEEPAEAGEDEAVIGAERMDEIKSLLDRRRTSAARCLTDVIDDGKLGQNARGRLALAFTITEAGRATGVKVLEDTLESPELEQCVIGKLQQIEFGELPRKLEWSYTFAFEAM